MSYEAYNGVGYSVFWSRCIILSRVLEYVAYGNEFVTHYFVDYIEKALNIFECLNEYAVFIRFIFVFVLLFERKDCEF